MRSYTVEELEMDINLENADYDNVTLKVIHGYKELEYVDGKYLMSDEEMQFWKDFKLLWDVVVELETQLSKKEEFEYNYTFFSNCDINTEYYERIEWLKSKLHL